MVTKVFQILIVKVFNFFILDDPKISSYSMGVERRSAPLWFLKQKSSQISLL